MERQSKQLVKVHIISDDARVIICGALQPVGLTQPENISRRCRRVLQAFKLRAVLAL